MTEPTDPAALSDEVATAIAWLRDHAATDDFGRDFSRNKRHGAIADLLTRLSARVTEAERNLAVANDELSCCQVELEQLENIEEEKITAERRLETARAALEKIERWDMPVSGHFWDKDKKEPMSYGAAFGSNGERDHIKSVAAEALAALQPQDAPENK